MTPTTQSLDFTHMYDFTKPRIPTKYKYTPNTMMDFLDSNVQFSIFKYIVIIAGMDGILDSEMSNFTLFLPSDRFIKNKLIMNLEDLDKQTAIEIVKRHLLNNKIPYATLQSSRSMILNTVCKRKKILINSEYSEIVIDDDIRFVEKDIIMLNGLIHVINGII